MMAAMNRKYVPGSEICIVALSTGFVSPGIISSRGRYSNAKYQLESKSRCVHSIPSVHRCTYMPVRKEEETRRSYTTTCQSPTSTEKRQRLGVLVSGSGRSVENLCERIDNGILERCEIGVVICSKSKAGALQRVRRFNVDMRIVRPIDFDKDTALFSNAISNVLDDCNIDVIVMAGWMHFYLIPQRFEGRVLNIHPSLIPSFCGKGYYGSRVHEAAVCYRVFILLCFWLPFLTFPVEKASKKLTFFFYFFLFLLIYQLSFGVKISGCTVHIADNKYDHGPIILQKSVPVFDTDSADELGSRVFEQEKEALPEAVQLFVDGRLQVENGIVTVLAQSQATRK